MKFIIFGLALVACVMADVSELGYDYHAPAPVEHHEVMHFVPEALKNTYIPPADHAPAPEYQPASAPDPVPEYHSAPVVTQNTYIPPAAPASVPEYHPAPAAAPVAPQNTYIPPAAPASVPEYHPAPAPAPVAPQNTYIPPAAPAPVEQTAELADDGYRYKTVRRVVYRYRY